MASCPGTKVATRYQAVDWYKQLNATVAASELQRKDAWTARTDAKTLTELLKLKTRWGQHDSNVQLSQRIDEVQKWKDTMERKEHDLDREIATLSMAKEQAERAIDDKIVHLQVINFCLTTRDQRQRMEVVKDSLDDEMIKEAEVISKAKELLNKKCNEAIEQLCTLQNMRNDVNSDILDKRITLAIDCDQLHLDNEAENKSFKMNASRIPENMLTHEQWVEKNTLKALNAQAEIASSQRMREDMYNLILQTDNDVMSQKDVTEFEFRKRMHEVRQAVDEHIWQKKNLEDEISAMELSILDAEDSFRAKSNAMKLLETRLENRNYRPNFELCLDEAHKELLDEWKRLQNVLNLTRDTISKLRSKLTDLSSTHELISKSLLDKTHALQLDVRCMEERQKLPNSGITVEDTDKLIHSMGINQNLPETNWIEAATNPTITSGRWNTINPNVNQVRTAWELGRTDPKLLSNQIGINPKFAKSGYYANALAEKSIIH